MIADVVARLNAIRVDLSKQRQQTLSLAGQVDEATRRLATVIGTSTNPYARAALARLATGGQRLREGAQLAHGAEEAVASYVGIITGTKAGVAAANPPTRSHPLLPRPGHRRRQSTRSDPTSDAMSPQDGCTTPTGDR